MWLRSITLLFPLRISVSIVSNWLVMNATRLENSTIPSRSATIPTARFTALLAVSSAIEPPSAICRKESHH